MTQNLITRLSKLDAPDREVDAMLYCFQHGHTYSRKYGNDYAMWVEGVPHEVRIADLYLDKFTGSLDAIKLLARRLYPDVMYRVGNDGEGPDPSLYLGELFIPGEQKDSYFTGLSPVDAVSLCIALLRAKEASKL